jgi:hypothetical protein
MNAVEAAQLFPQPSTRRGMLRAAFLGGTALLVLRPPGSAEAACGAAAWMTETAAAATFTAMGYLLLSGPLGFTVIGVVVMALGAAWLGSQLLKVAVAAYSQIGRAADSVVRALGW